MEFKEIAEHLYPFWILGVMIMGLVITAGHGYLLRIEKKQIVKWTKFLLYITLWRMFLSKFLNFHGIGASPQSVNFLPLAVAATVFWEDACHGLPLFIFKKLTKGWKWAKPLYWLLLSLVMIEFGMGHVYQGVLSAAILSFYIPFSVKMGEKHGFGTVMLCHMMYDFVTLFFVKYLMGL